LFLDAVVEVFLICFEDLFTFEDEFVVDFDLVDLLNSVFHDVVVFI